MQDQYIHDDTYHAAVNSLEAIARAYDPADPDDLRTKIIEALGNLGVWPIECLEAQEGMTPRLVA